MISFLLFFIFIFESYFSYFQKQQISLIQQIMLPPSCTLLTFLTVQASSKSLTPVCGVYNVVKGQVLFISLCTFVYNLGNQCVFWISLFTVKQQTARILFVSRLSHTLLSELQPPIAWLMSIISKTMKMSKSKLCAHKQCCVKFKGMRLSGKVLVWFMSMDVRAVLWIFCSEPPHFFPYRHSFISTPWLPTFFGFYQYWLMAGFLGQAVINLLNLVITVTCEKCKTTKHKKKKIMAISPADIFAWF